MFCEQLDECVGAHVWKCWKGGCVRLCVHASLALPLTQSVCACILSGSAGKGCGVATEQRSGQGLGVQARASTCGKKTALREALWGLPVLLSVFPQAVLALSLTDLLCNGFTRVIFTGFCRKSCYAAVWCFDRRQRMCFLYRSLLSCVSACMWLSWVCRFTVQQGGVGQGFNPVPLQLINRVMCLCCASASAALPEQMLC